MTDLPPSPSVCLSSDGALTWTWRLVFPFHRGGARPLGPGETSGLPSEWWGALRAYLYWSDLHTAVLWRMPEHSSLRELRLPAMRVGSSLGQHLNCVLVCLPARKVWKDIYTEWGLGVQVCEAAAAAPEYSDLSVGIGGPDFQCCPPFSWLYHTRPGAAAVHTKPAWPSLPAYITPETPPYGFDLVRPFLSLAPPWHIGGGLASVFLAFLLRPWMLCVVWAALRSAASVASIVLLVLIPLHSAAERTWS